MEFRSFVYFACIILGYLTLNVILHGLPESRFKDRALEWFGWLGAIAAAFYIIMPWKVIQPHVPLLGHTDDISVAFMLAFSAMTAGCARERWKARRKVDQVKTKENQHVQLKAEPRTVVLA